MGIISHCKVRGLAEYGEVADDYIPVVQNRRQLLKTVLSTGSSFGMLAREL
jgi:hypothetical protein